VNARRLAAIALVAVLGVALAIVVWRRGDSTTARADPPAVKAALEARLRGKGLTFRWVACVANGRTYQGLPIVRCNVNFGDPHIEAYCSVLDHGRLVTDHDRPAIPCSRDEAGQTAPVVTS
jgi:hypothetical protein